MMYGKKVTLSYSSKLILVLAILSVTLPLNTRSITVSTPSGLPCVFNRDLYVSIMGEDVRCLQRYLNEAGFVLATSGFGSPGNESDFFGPRTRNALSKWQIANGITPTAGYFGPLSRRKYNSLLPLPPLPPIVSRKTSPPLPPLPAPPAATGKATTTTVPSLPSTENILPTDPASLIEHFAIAGTANVAITGLRFEGGLEPVILQQVGLTFDQTTASAADIVSVSLWDGGVIVGRTIFSGTANTTTLTLTNEVIIPQNEAKTLTVRADIAPVGINQPGGTGHFIKIEYDAASPLATRGVGQWSGLTINPSLDTNATANTGVRLVKTIPVVDTLGIPTNTLSNGENVLYHFKITANLAGDIGVYKFSFHIATSTATLTNFSLYGYADAILSTNAYSKNPLNQTPIASPNASGIVELYFNPAAGGGHEPIEIPAGSPRYFELRGTAANVASGATASISLEGDAAFFASGYTGTASGVDADPNNNFIWSPNTETTAVPVTSDWLNGYLVPGLSSAGSVPQILSH